MQKLPKISVLTPVYNTNPLYLREMIESILNQTYSDFEFLILNDSPDNKEIENIIKEYAKQDKRVKYYKNNKNIGISKSRNKLLDLARGEYIAIFDHDDISMPTRFESQVECLDKNQDIGVVSSWVEIIGNKNEIFKYPEHDKEIKMLLTDDCHVCHSGTMIRKSVLDKNNIKYEEEFSPAEDYAIFIRLMGVTEFYIIQKSLVKYRMHGKNTSVQKSDLMYKNSEILKTLVKNKYPYYYYLFRKNYEYRTCLKLRLFGFIPVLKIRKNTVYLFDVLPILKIKWK